jgi:iron complex transport system substrate-binding protein
LKFKTFYISILTSAVLFGCHQAAEQRTANASFKDIHFAKLFGIAEMDSFSQLFYINDKDTLWSIKSTEIPKSSSKIIVLSTVYAGFLEALGLQNQIVGVDRMSYYSDSVLSHRSQTNLIAEVGEENQLNLEKIINLKPDFIFCTSVTANDESLRKRLNKFNIRLIACDNYKEQHPLARAEWLKMFAFVTNHTSMADSLFEVIKNNYNQLVKVSQSFDIQPLVLTDALFSDVWNVPGANTYTAKLIHDAGAKYVFDDKTSSYTHPLNLETVLKRAQKADVWINVSQFNSLEEMIRTEKRYALFKAFNDARVYNYNKKINAQGGNDFWETGVVRPDWVLSDLIEIFHPNKNNQTNLFFYRRLD